jgi:hypothetical protein
MTDTIELLEAIGRDASLRHVSSEELARILKQAEASQALTAAVASGDRSLLSAELGHKVNDVPQATQSPGYEEDEPDQATEKSNPSPATEDGKTPAEKSAK